MDTRNNSSDNCCICMENLNDNNNIKILNCGHSFHRNCINQWNRNHPSCPLCRTSTPIITTPIITRQPRRIINEGLYLMNNNPPPPEAPRIIRGQIRVQRNVIYNDDYDNLTIREILLSIIIILTSLIILSLYNSTMKACLCDINWEHNQTHKTVYSWIGTSTSYSRSEMCIYIC